MRSGRRDLRTQSLCKSEHLFSQSPGRGDSSGFADKNHAFHSRGDCYCYVDVVVGCSRPPDQSRRTTYRNDNKGTESRVWKQAYLASVGHVGGVRAKYGSRIHDVPAPNNQNPTAPSLKTRHNATCVHVQQDSQRPDTYHHFPSNGERTCSNESASPEKAARLSSSVILSHALSSTQSLHGFARCPDLSTPIIVQINAQVLPCRPQSTVQSTL